MVQSATYVPLRRLIVAVRLLPPPAVWLVKARAPPNVLTTVKLCRICAADVLRKVNFTRPAFRLFGTPVNLNPVFWSPLMPIVAELDAWLVRADALTATAAATISMAAGARTANALRFMRCSFGGLIPPAGGREAPEANRALPRSTIIIYAVKNPSRARGRLQAGSEDLARG